MVLFEGEVVVIMSFSNHLKRGVGAVDLGCVLFRGWCSMWDVVELIFDRGRRNVRWLFHIVPLRPLRMSILHPCSSWGALVYLEWTNSRLSRSLITFSDSRHGALPEAFRRFIAGCLGCASQSWRFNGRNDIRGVRRRLALKSEFGARQAYDKDLILSYWTDKKWSKVASNWCIHTWRSSLKVLTTLNTVTDLIETWMESSLGYLEQWKTCHLAITADLVLATTKPSYNENLILSSLALSQNFSQKTCATIFNASTADTYLFQHQRLIVDGLCQWCWSVNESYNILASGPFHSGVSSESLIFVKIQGMCVSRRPSGC